MKRPTANALDNAEIAEIYKRLVAERISAGLDAHQAAIAARAQIENDLGSETAGAALPHPRVSITAKTHADCLREIDAGPPSIREGNAPEIQILRLSHITG